MRWIYHLVPAGTLVTDRYEPPSLAREGFVHGSFRDEVCESARLYFPAGAELVAWRIDPRRLDARVEIAATPRGPMPHVHGAIPRDAVREEIPLARIDAAPDVVTGHRVALVAFRGVTLLDLVGVWDPLARLRTAGIDLDARCEVVSADAPSPFSHDGATLTCARVRPPLDDFDLVVIPGGPGAERLLEDHDVLDWLKAWPRGRWIASVCTGALLLGATGRLAGRRATTHPRAMAELCRFGAMPTEERVVVDGNVVTAGGVTAAIDLGLRLVGWLANDAAAADIARQMSWR